MYLRRYVITGVVVSLVIGLLLLASAISLAQPLAGSSAADVPSSAAISFQSQPLPQTWVLWFAPPDVPKTDDWTLLAEAYHAVRLTQHAVIERRLSALKVQGVIIDFGGVESGVAFTVTDSLPPEVYVWPEIARVTAYEVATAEAFDAWERQGLDLTLLAPSQATTLTLNLGIHSHLVSGVTPNPEPIALRLLRDSVELASATATPLPDGLGSYVYVATLVDVQTEGAYSGGCNPNIQPGDVLEAVQAAQTITLTVPTLTALADQATATIYGQSTPEAALDVYTYRYGDNTVVYRQTVTATVDGDYMADFGALTPFAPRDYGYVFFTDGSHRVYARFNVPLVSVGIDANHVSGFVAPCVDVTLDLYDAQLAPIQSALSGYTTGDGAFSIYVYPYPTVGDTVVVSAAGQTISVTLFDLTASPDPDSDVITGSAPVSATVEIDVYRGPINFYESCSPAGVLEGRVTTVSTISGTYIADFTGQTDFVAGHFGAVYAMASPGAQVYRCFAVPFLRASMDKYRVKGQVNGGGEATVSIRGASGALRDVHRVPVYPSGYFRDYDPDSGLRLLAGDWITVTGPDGVDTGMHVPTLTVHIDRAHSLVYGDAPPGSRLRVGVYVYAPTVRLLGGGPPPASDFSHTLWVTATATGVYTADFSALAPFEGEGYGEVTYLEPHGHEAYREFSISTGPLISVQSGSNCVTGNTGSIASGSTSLVVTLRGVDGQTRATETLWNHYGGSFYAYLYDSSGQPAIIGPGDTVEVTIGDTTVIPTPTPPWPTMTPFADFSGEVDGRDLTLLAVDAEVVSVTVPTLTIQADFAADVVYGEAPPDSVLRLEWSDNDIDYVWPKDIWQWAVTSTLTGTYHLDVGAHVDIDPAGRFTLTWTDVNGNEVWRQYQPPYLSAILGDRQVTVYGDVHHPITLTVSDSDGARLYTQTTALYQSTWATFYLYDQNDFSPLFLDPDYVLDVDWGDTARQLTLPQLTALADADSDVISGEGPPAAQLLVNVYTQAGTWQEIPVTVTVAGTYTLDLSGVIDLTVGSSGQVLYRHPEGHRIVRRFGIPTLEVVLGEPYVRGYNYGTWSGPLTVSLYSEIGLFKGSGVNDFGGSGSFSAYLRDDSDVPVTVSGSDHIVVESVDNPTFTFTVPTLTAIYDVDVHILHGVAPADAWLRVELGQYVRQIPVDTMGAYAMDWRDVAPHRGTRGTIHHRDSYGNQTSLRFEVPWLRVYVPLVLRSP